MPPPEATRRIFLVEDDKALITEAQKHLPERYYVVDVPLGEASTPEYWRVLSLTPHDLPIIDINLKMNYSGKDLLRLLRREKKSNNLPGLEQVLIATAMENEIIIYPGESRSRIVHPDISEVEGFRVYGFEKGKRETLDFGPGGKVRERKEVDLSGYGPGLAAIIEQIYGGRATQLNK